MLILSLLILACFNAPDAGLVCPQKVVRPCEGDNFATSLIVLGDINGDGTDDFLVSDPYREGVHREEGWVVAVSGATHKAIWSRFAGECHLTLGIHARLMGDQNADGIQDAGLSAGWFLERDRLQFWTLSGANGEVLRQESISRLPELSLPRDLPFRPGYVEHVSLCPEEPTHGIRKVKLVQEGETPAVVVMQDSKGAILGQRDFPAHWETSHCSYFLSAIGDVDGDRQGDVLVGIDMPTRAMYQVWSGADLQSVWEETVQLDNMYDLEWATCNDLDADGTRDLLCGMHWLCGGPDVRGYIEARSGRTGKVLFRLTRADLE